jgi:hypothetical protein
VKELEIKLGGAGNHISPRNSQIEKDRQNRASAIPAVRLLLAAACGRICGNDETENEIALREEPKVIQGRHV